MSQPINPVFWLELRLRLRERKLWVVSLAFVLILLGVTSAIFGMNRSVGSAMPDAHVIGSALLWADFVTLLGLLLLIAGLAGAGRIAQEREQRTLAGLLNTPLTSAQIVWGKLLGSWAFVGWFLFLSLPFVGAMLYWGAPWQRVLGGFAVCAGSALTVSAVAIGFSGLFRNALTSYLATGFFLFIWLVVLPVIGGASHLAHANDGMANPYLPYFLFHPNPFVALYAALKEAPQAGEALPPAWLWPSVAGIWVALGLAAFGAAVAGLRRGLFGPS